MSWTADAPACRSWLIRGKAGRYMSIQSGPKIDRLPTSSTRRQPAGTPRDGRKSRPVNPGPPAARVGTSTTGTGLRSVRLTGQRRCAFIDCNVRPVRLTRRGAHSSRCGLFGRRHRVDPSLPTCRAASGLLRWSRTASGKDRSGEALRGPFGLAELGRPPERARRGRRLEHGVRRPSGLGAEKQLGEVAVVEGQDEQADRYRQGDRDGPPPVRAR